MQRFSVTTFFRQTFLRQLAGFGAALTILGGLEPLITFSRLVQWAIDQWKFLTAAFWDIALQWLPITLPFETKLIITLLAIVAIAYARSQPIVTLVNIDRNKRLQKTLEDLHRSYIEHRIFTPPNGMTALTDRYHAKKDELERKSKSESFFKVGFKKKESVLLFSALLILFAWCVFVLNTNEEDVVTGLLAGQDHNSVASWIIRIGLLLFALAFAYWPDEDGPFPTSRLFISFLILCLVVFSTFPINEAKNMQNEWEFVVTFFLLVLVCMWTIAVSLDGRDAGRLLWQIIILSSLLLVVNFISLGFETRLSGLTI